MARKRDQTPPQHKDNEVRKLIRAAIRAGWFVEHPGSHAWGWLVCGGVKPPPDGECRIVVFSTPKGDNQAKILRRTLVKCAHGQAPPP